jgi:hypothetical protein
VRLIRCRARHSITFRSANKPSQKREKRDAAHSLGLELLIVNASNESEIDSAFATLVQRDAHALFVIGDALFTTRREQLVSLAARNAIPTIFTFREFALAGGLISYGSVLVDRRLCRTNSEGDQASRLALPIQRQVPRGHACHVPRYATMDHPKGLAPEGQTTPSFGCARSLRRAGVVGAVARRPVGSFPYEKRFKNGRVVVCEVFVFLLKVRRQNKKWPERRQREIKWVSASQAANKVKEPLLSAIIRRLARKYD